MVNSNSYSCELTSYKTHDHIIIENNTYLTENDTHHKIDIFGNHNLQNLKAAQIVCEKIGVKSSEFYSSIE